LRKNPRTAEIPVLFMTARAQAREVEEFVALGAQGVISKPFDPMTLAFLVRSHLHAMRLDTMRKIFVQRAKSDSAMLASCRLKLAKDSPAATLGQVRTIAHGLAGAAGLYGFEKISDVAAALEEAVVNAQGGEGGAEEVVQALDRLTASLDGEWSLPRTACVQAAHA
jgi:CheY-like chemotaxis protein